MSEQVISIGYSIYSYSSIQTNERENRNTRVVPRSTNGGEMRWVFFFKGFLFVFWKNLTTYKYRSFWLYLFHVDKSILLKNKSLGWFGYVFLAPLGFSASKKLFRIDFDIT